jgi:hypothetical protein
VRYRTFISRIAAATRKTARGFSAAGCWLFRDLGLKVFDHRKMVLKLRQCLLGEILHGRVRAVRREVFEGGHGVLMRRDTILDVS